MKIVFFGNTDFGTPTLDLLKDQKFNILAIVTNEDRKVGRGKSLSETPIKKWTTSNDVALIQEDDLKSKSFIEKISAFKADFFVVIAYKLLPPEIFNLPKFGAINLHASFLPFYRGAAPIQRSILNNDSETGVSTFLINERIDAGEIILREKVLINNKNYGELHSELSILGATLMIDSIDHIIKKKPLTTQKEKTTYAYKINKSETQIDWSMESNHVLNSIRAFSPSPGAYTYFQGKRVRIIRALKSEIVLDQLGVSNISIYNRAIYVGTNNGMIQVKELQLEGKQVMTDSSFINGYLRDPDKTFKFEKR